MSLALKYGCGMSRSKSKKAKIPPAPNESIDKLLAKVRAIASKFNHDKAWAQAKAVANDNELQAKAVHLDMEVRWLSFSSMLS